MYELEKSNRATVSDPSAQKSFWNKIWKLGVPNKVKLFLWRACSDALPTKVNLERRKIIVDLVYSQSLDCPETSLHALWEYGALPQIWDHDFGWVKSGFPHLHSFSNLVFGLTQNQASWSYLRRWRGGVESL